ncbi:MAG: hypothetical protein FJ388_17845, partial [Verrucomicrobia bacterium]|nr:hypothetical protein [Verrucomicrobiota bacterium]
MFLVWSPVLANAAPPAKTADPAAPLKQADLPALRRAIEDLATSFPDRYPNGAAFFGRLKALEQQQTTIEQALARKDAAAAQQAQALAGEAARLRSEALLANPLLDFDKLLVVKRASGNIEVVELDRKTKKQQKKSVGRNLGLPQNWQGNCALPRKGYENEIAVLSPVRPEGKFTTLYKPDGGKFVGDVCLNFDADKMMFSSIGAQDRWHIFEMGADGKNPRQITPSEPDVDNYYPCYLPDGRIIFGSTACFHGVPCVGGGNTVANLYRMDADGANIRRLCFDQDHNWYPVVANDGRVLYTRWEYSDSPHYFTRILFRMNPDGTGQMEYYASNSYWPNSIF